MARRSERAEWGTVPPFSSRRAMAGGRFRRRVSTGVLAVPVALAFILGGGRGGDPGALASSGEGALEPTGKGLQLLGGREAILLEQSERARRATRARALTLYRLLRVAALERNAAGTGTAHPGRMGARAVALATAVLARDLEEARALRAELDRVREERAALAERLTAPAPGGPDGEAPGSAGPQASPATLQTAGPGFLPPVQGALVMPFGVARDAGSGAWIFRAAASFAATSGEIVRSPADAQVARVGESVAGGAAVVLSIEQDEAPPSRAPRRGQRGAMPSAAEDRHGTASSWTVVVSGLASVAVAPGEAVRRGEALGTARATPPSSVRIETWLGRSPVDPAVVLRGH